MLLVPTKLQVSAIHGTGVFVLVPVKKGETIWSFDARFDRIYTEPEVSSLPQFMQDFLRPYTCQHKDVHLHMLCGDNMRYANHAEMPNLASNGIFGPDYAAVNLEAGEELTVDYRSRCCESVQTCEVCYGSNKFRDHGTNVIRGESRWERWYGGG